MILNNELLPLRKQIRAMWEQRLDTMDMAKAMQLPEALIERELHAVLEIRRSVVNSLVTE